MQMQYVDTDDHYIPVAALFALFARWSIGPLPSFLSCDDHQNFQLEWTGGPIDRDRSVVLTVAQFQVFLRALFLQYCLFVDGWKGPFRIPLHLSCLVRQSLSRLSSAQLQLVTKRPYDVVGCPRTPRPFGLIQTGSKNLIIWVILYDFFLVWEYGQFDNWHYPAHDHEHDHVTPHPHYTTSPEWW